MNAIRFWLNDRLVEEFAAPPTTTLLEYLRFHLHLTGTKEGCAEGDCGACTVAVLDAEAPGGPTYRAINSCLLLLPMLHGQRVYTVEALKRDGVHHPVQESLVQHLGSQCGYCTPGVVMSLFEACYRTDLDAEWKLDDQMCGNLCRCTGYRPIRDAAHEIAGTRPDDHFGRMLAGAHPEDRGLAYEAGGQRFFQPTSTEALLDLMQANTEHRLVGGATDLGLEVTKRFTRFPCLISLGAIAELRRVEPIEGGWAIGAAARLSDIEVAVRDALPPLARMLRFFGSRQIKHGATLGGNLCTASPIGDTPPVLLALGATAIARSHAGERAIPLDDFFLSYRETALQPGEVLVRVEVPSPPPDARVGAYKVSKRRELDISAVSAGMLVRVDGEGRTAEARIAYGGMAAVPKRARHAEEALVGRPWDHETVVGAAIALARDFTPITDLRGSAWYRATVARNLLIGFFEETCEERVPHLPDRPSGTVLSQVKP
jgi:xanthine dehydrogenase small subunit